MLSHLNIGGWRRYYFISRNKLINQAILDASSLMHLYSASVDDFSNSSLLSRCPRDWCATKINTKDTGRLAIIKITCLIIVGKHLQFWSHISMKEKDMSCYMN